MLGRSSLVIGALLAAGLSVQVVPEAQVRAVNRAAPQRGRAILPVFSGRGGATRGRRAGPGWSNRHAQRVAAKKRNVVRHRARSRGRA